MADQEQERHFLKVCLLGLVVLLLGVAVIFALLFGCCALAWKHG
jgi:hypothetical protein